MRVAVAKRVLVVEDNELNLKLFCDLLRAHEYVAEPVRDGREAVARTRDFRPDLVIMDIQMPHVTGYDLILELKRDADLAAIPVMAVTAYAVVRSLDLGFLELDVLARDRVVFAEAHLLGRVPGVFLGDVIEARVGGADELDLDGGRLGHEPWNPAKRVGSGGARHRSISRGAWRKRRRKSTAARRGGA